MAPLISLLGVSLVCGDPCKIRSGHLAIGKVPRDTGTPSILIAKSESSESSEPISRETIHFLIFLVLQFSCMICDSSFRRLSWRRNKESVKVVPWSRMATFGGERGWDFYFRLIVFPNF